MVIVYFDSYRSFKREIGIRMLNEYNVNYNYVNKHGFDAITLCITKRLRNLANLLCDKGQILSM